MGVLDILSGVSAAAGPTLVGLGGVAMSLSPPEFKRARHLIRIGCAVTIFWIVAFGIFDSSDATIKVLVCGFLGSLVFGSSGYLSNWIKHREQIYSEMISQSYVPIDEQNIKLKKIANVFAMPEIELRGFFDTFTIVDINVNVQKIRLESRLSTAKFLYTDHCNGGSVIFLAKEGHFSTGPTGVHVDEKDNDVLFLVVTKKYIEAHKMMSEVASDPMIPSKIKEMISSYLSIVNQNMELLIWIFGERLTESIDFILKYNEYGSPYYKVINNDFAVKMKVLKPYADNILKEISRHWRVD
jgi:hypothetical protein